VVWSTASRSYAPSTPDSYAYAPSAVAEGGHTYYFSCHNTVSGAIADSAWFAEVDRGKVRRQYPALLPSADGWDSHHVCDPSVVAGDFGFAGARYGYAMFYLGTEEDNTDNQIGVAFATSLAGPWVRSSTPIVGISPDAASTWGVGQPTATTVDPTTGSVLLFYTDATSGGTVADVRRLELGEDGHWVVGPPVVVTTAGLGGDQLHNFDVAYDPGRDRFYVAREAGPPPVDAPTNISTRIEVDSIPAAELATGTWRVEGDITPALTGSARNHNPGILRTVYGTLPAEKHIDVAFSRSPTGAFPGTLFTYDLWTIAGTLR
jgi:hypothetical protein